MTNKEFAENLKEIIKTDSELTDKQQLKVLFGGGNLYINLNNQNIEKLETKKDVAKFVVRIGIQTYNSAFRSLVYDRISLMRLSYMILTSMDFLGWFDKEKGVVYKWLNY
jgi:tyrosyl-tRNA synthetase